MCYYDLQQLNKIKHDKSASLSLLHTNLASINKHFDGLMHVISQIKTEFDVIGITVEQFNQDYIEPMLDKLCATMGDFNIDLLKSEHNIMMMANTFFNNLTTTFFTPYILQPTRLASKTLIDNIFINSIDFSSYSGNTYSTFFK